jgi:transposase
MLLFASDKERESGCRLVFLPPYSPDFNPIEKFWAYEEMD